MDRDQLVQLVTEIKTTAGCRFDLDEMINRLERNFPGKNVARMIFEPPAGKEMSPEQIVDWALSQNDQKL